MGRLLAAGCAAAIAAAAGVVEAGPLPTFSADSLGPAGEALKSAGAVLLAGAASDLRDFRRLALETWRAAGHDDLGLGGYQGGTVYRPELADGVYDVGAGAQADLPVPVHQEKAYMLQVPRFVGFACFRPAEEGGELLISDQAKISSGLPQSMLDKLRSQGVTYMRRYGDAELTPNFTYPTGSWQTRFQTRDFAEAQRQARSDTQLGADGASLELQPDLTARLSWRSPATAAGEGGEERLVQSILDYHNSSGVAVAGAMGMSAIHATWGDGDEFSSEEVAALKAAAQRSVAASVKLRAGDVILLDNFRFGHGREAYRGQRKHAALMSQDVPRAVRFARCEEDACDSAAAHL